MTAEPASEVPPPTTTGIMGEVVALFREFDDEGVRAMNCGCEHSAQGLHLVPGLRWDCCQDSSAANRIGDARAAEVLSHVDGENEFDEPDFALGGEPRYL